MPLKSSTLFFRQPADEPGYELTTWLFLRGLAMIYFAAFASMATQVEGLIGSSGILPIHNALQQFARTVPDEKYLLFPTLFWLDHSDQALIGACYIGMAAAALLLLNVLNRLALVLCYCLYLSIAVAGQDFTAFQWDALLLEAGFLAVFLTSGSPIIVFLYRFLIARFMFMAGVVKLASGDPSWANLTALNFHYQTQPLPSPLAYYAYYLPQWFNEMCVIGVLIIELIVPFFVFLPRRFRHFAAWSFIVLQSSIILTGNYNFFNLLTILLCLFLFDDRDFNKILPSSLISAIVRKRRAPGFMAHTLAAIWLVIVLITCSTNIWRYHNQQQPPTPFNTLVKVTSAFWVVNNYGPFSVMTTQRPEIILQGSNDSKHWRAYKFKYKPVDLDKNLSWNIPHQPRLDWQMWFAALSTADQNPWFGRLMDKLLDGSPQVLSLLAYNPFPEHPPAHVRALLYRYSFTTPEQRKATGQIWRREYLGEYWPVNLTLSDLEKRPHSRRKAGIQHHES